MAKPGRLFQFAIVPVTAFAAIAEVPIVATALITRILPNWNILFSIPFGIAIYRIFLIRLPLNFQVICPQRLISFFGWNISKKITIAATYREMVVGIATPATPMCKP